MDIGFAPTGTEWRHPDDLKLKSSMTLFYEVTGNDVFKKVLDKFYGGQEDQFTVDALRKER